jgi:hypothetical protein
MANTLLFNPFIQVVDANGKPYAGAKLYTYITNTSTPLATYTDAALTTPHANPVVADANGTFPPIYLQKQSYKLILKTSADVTIDQSDPVDSTESAVEQYVNALLQTTLTEIINDLYAGVPYRATNAGSDVSQLFSVNSATTTSNYGVNASGEEVRTNYGHVNTSGNNIRTAYVTGKALSRTTGSETGSLEFGVKGASAAATTRMTITENAATVTSGWFNYAGNSDYAGLTTLTNGVALGWNYSGGQGESIIAFHRGTGSGGNGALTFREITGGTYLERMRIGVSGEIYFPAVGTTASAANAFLNSGNLNQLLRSTSSIRYKADVEDLPNADAYKALDLRPVTYKSTVEADDPHKTHFGLIAEEVATIEPRLVHYVDGVPDGVQYERLAVMLLKVVQDLRQEVDSLKAQIQGA